VSRTRCSVTACGRKLTTSRHSVTTSPTAAVTAPATPAGVVRMGTFPAASEVRPKNRLYCLPAGEPPTMPVTSNGASLGTADRGKKGVVSLVVVHAEALSSSAVACCAAVRVPSWCLISKGRAATKVCTRPALWVAAWQRASLGRMETASASHPSLQDNA
jgi:hypothetical protein